MVEPQRIMRARLTPLRRSERIFATWSTTDRHGSITVSGGNLIATGTIGSWAALRATLAIGGGQYYWETLSAFGAGTDVLPGIALAAAALNAKLGTVGGATGGPDKLGDFWRDGIKILDLASPATGAIVRHWLDADAGIYRVAIEDGVWNVATANPSNTYAVWYPAAGVLSGASCTANFGQQPFAYPVPRGARPGVYEQPVTPVSIYVSSDKYGSSDIDDPPNQPYAARIAGDSDVDIEREASCWVWGGQSRASRGDLVLITDPSVAWWASLIWRDAEVVIDRGLRTPAGDTWSEWTHCRVEKHAENGRRLVLTLTDELARLDRPLQDSLYPENQGNQQLVHRARPVCFGRPMYMQGAQLTTLTAGPNAYTYEISDAPIQGIDGIFDRGNPFVYGDDWEYLPNRRGFRLLFKPDNPVTCNPRGAMRKMETLIDSANGGDFTAWTSGAYDTNPEGWFTVGEDNKGRCYVSPGAGSSAVLISDGSAEISIAKGALSPGEWYELHVDVVDVTSGVLTVGTDVDRPITLDAVGSFVHVFEAGEGATLCVIGGTDCHVTIGRVRLYRVTLIQYIEDWLHELLYVRGGVPYERIDWDAIDELAVADGRNRRLAFTGDINLQALLRLTLDSWCGAIFVRRSGQISVTRIDAPAGVASVRLGPHNLVGMPRRSLDEASGLTTRLAGRRNYSPHDSSDIFSTATPDVIAELTAEFLVVRSGLPTSVKHEVDAAVVGQQLRQAIAAEPKEVLLQDADDIQAEASRVCTLWRGSAVFWEVDVVLSAAAADDLEPGDEVWLQYPGIDGLDAGQFMRVRRVRSSFFSGVVRLLLWDPVL